MSETSEESISSKVTTAFKHDIIKDVLKSKFANPKNKITDEAIELVSEIAKVMVVEAAARAAQQASLEDKKIVSLDHVENILPQMVN
ncbi:hypothetical protein NQ314_012965 [Rhamnusium bicolor]|uniref:Centromere protein X n=1 Tax=Rhamnusium bicolor TaxID=1586634 RepID=A0AAV8X960_9CUCU|nr:hypothetical protein NQ314_012965 [Rhamnusium bicolor]